MTFKEIYNWLESKNRSLIIPTQFIPTVPDWYNDLDMLTLGQDSLDRLYLTVKYPDSVSAFDADLLDITISGIMKKNEYMFNNLYRTIIQKYNPIENYDRYEDTKLNINGSNSQNRKLVEKSIRSGSESSTDSGSVNFTKNGNVTDTDTMSGSETRKQTGSVINTGSIRAFNSGMTEVNKNVSSTPDGTSDTLSFDGRQNRHERSFSGYSENTTFNGRKNERVYNDVTDSTESTDIDSGVRKDEHTTESHIHGNIGVTTSAQMLESERQLSIFDFIDIVYTTIISELSCGFVDPEEGYYYDD